MTKTKSTKRALLTSGLALLLCLSMFVGTTFAWFTDSVVSGNNKIVAGNLDIELEHYVVDENGVGSWETVSGATNLFSDSLWEPGYTEVVYLRLSNLGTLALKYELAINIVSETPGTNVAGDEFYLSDYIKMGVVENIDGQNNPYSKDAAGRAKAIAEATNATIISEGYVADGEMAADADDLYLAVVVYMPTSVDNVANYLTDTDAPEINLGINLIATQLEYEEDSFGDDYDEAAKYVISSNEEMIFNGNEFDTLVTNNGTVDMTNAKIENDNIGFENYGAATLNNVIVNAGTPGTQAYGYAINAYAGSTTVLNDVTVNSANGAIGVVDGANLTFNSGSVEVDSKSTSGRYLFYVVGAGSTLTINDGNFDFNKTQNQKRAYIYAEAGTTVYVNGGTFGKASTRSGYTAGILGDGDVIITGGTFGFNPSAWLKTGYKAEKVGTNWVVVPEQVDAIVGTADALQTALNEANGDYVIYVNGTIDGDVTATQKLDTKVTIEGNGNTFNGALTVDGQSKRYDTAGLTIKNFKFTSDSVTLDAYVNLGNGNSGTRYTNNVTVSGCTFDYSGSDDKVAIKSYTGGDWNLKVEGCTANAGMHSLLQVTNVEKGLTITDCKVYSKNGINLNNTPSLTMSGCEFDTIGYCVRLGVNGSTNSGNFEISNSTLKSANDDGDAVIILRGNMSGATVTLLGTTLTGTPDVSGTANIVK